MACHRVIKQAIITKISANRLMVKKTRVKWFNPTKGYGFIVPEEGEKNIFLHITAAMTAGLQGLTEGQKVNYQVAEEPKGLKAVDITLNE
jgi:CspA family cold shock protein